MAIGAVLPETSLAIDTDVLTDWRYQKPHALQPINLYIERAKKPPALTSISVFEALYGFENKFAKSGALDHRTVEDKQKMEQLINACPVLPFNQAAAAIAAYIFPRLPRSEQNKHWRDILITATVLANGHGLITRNQKDFELIAKDLPANYPLLRLAILKA